MAHPERTPNKLPPVDDVFGDPAIPEKKKVEMLRARGELKVKSSEKGVRRVWRLSVLHASPVRCEPRRVQRTTSAMASARKRMPTDPFDRSKALRDRRLTPDVRYGRYKRENSHIIPLCVCCWCIVHQALSTPPPHTIGHHKGVSPQRHS